MHRRNPTQQTEEANKRAALKLQEEQDYQYALSLQEQLDAETLPATPQPAYAVPQRSDVIAVLAQELTKARIESAKAKKLLDDFSAVHSDETAAAVRTAFNQLLRENAANALFVLALQNASLSLSLEFPANRTEGCILSTDEITKEKIASGEQVVLLDDGNAYDLKAFVDYHNQRLPGHDCGSSDDPEAQKIKAEESHEQGKYVINPITHKPYSPQAVAHVFATIDKYNATKSADQQLTLHNVKGHNAGSNVENDQAAEDKLHADEGRALFEQFQADDEVEAEESLYYRPEPQADDEQPLYYRPEPPLVQRFGIFGAPATSANELNDYRTTNLFFHLINALLNEAAVQPLLILTTANVLVQHSILVIDDRAQNDLDNENDSLLRFGRN